MDNNNQRSTAASTTTLTCPLAAVPIESTSTSTSTSTVFVNDSVNVTTKKKSIRHAEKRRTATCPFADRIAQISIDHYRATISKTEQLPQTCLATIVAHDSNNGGKLTVLSMGVGTKFLSETILQQDANSSETSIYGRRVRDCHAEVLARRGLRRQLTLEILHDLQSKDATNNDNNIRIITQEHGILIRQKVHDRIQYEIRPGITLHLYSSSAPCGNATLKKFAKMSKEKYQHHLGPNEWDSTQHEPIHGSSLRLGEFALLIKKDSSSNGGMDTSEVKESSSSSSPPNAVHVLPFLSRKEQCWPANQSDDWTPPGTTIVGLPQYGSIHTCSDKICRWNFLGLQGSLLATLLKRPIYLSTMTVGRKFTSIICRRAVCCRLGRDDQFVVAPNASIPDQNDDDDNDGGLGHYHMNHPAVMGTAVYMDESGVVETNSEVRGQDVRFHSSRAWCWWSFLSMETNDISNDRSNTKIECLNGTTGYREHAISNVDSDELTTTSRISTNALTHLYLQAYQLANDSIGHDCDSIQPPNSLQELRKLKQQVSPVHEAYKEALLTKHRVFRMWKRRCSERVD